MRAINLAIVGATGLVGEAILKLLAERQFPVGELFLLASDNGAGAKVSFAGKSVIVKKAEDFDFSQVGKNSEINFCDRFSIKNCSTMQCDSTESKGGSQ